MLFRSAILQHAHGWVAKQSISVEVDQRISILGALQAAEARVIEGQITEVLEHHTPATLPRRVENKNVEAA